MVGTTKIYALVEKNGLKKGFIFSILFVRYIRRKALPKAKPYAMSLKKETTILSFFTVNQVETHTS